MFDRAGHGTRPEGHLCENSQTVDCSLVRIRAWDARIGGAQMATVLFATLRFAVIRRNDGAIEITTRDDPTKSRIVHTLESDLLDAYHREGLAGVDRLCEQLLAE